MYISSHSFVLTADSPINIGVSCNGSDIDVNFSVLALYDYYTCLLEYICFLPNGSSTTPRAIPSSVATLQPHYSVSTDTPLPGGTVCTVRGCYETDDFFSFAFDQSCTTGERMIANKYYNYDSTTFFILPWI